MSTPGAHIQPAVSRPFASAPGPRGLPLLGNAHQIRPESFHQQLEAWGKQYGQAFSFRITSRRFLAVSDPDAISAVLRQRPGIFHRGPRLVRVSRELGFYGVFTANGETWRRQRPMVLAGLDPSHIRSFLPAIAQVTARLRTRWQAAADSGRPFDLLADLMRYTVDVTTGLAFGHDLNTLEQSGETAIQQHLNVIFPALFKRVLAPVDVAHWIKDRKIARHADALQQAVRGFVDQASRQLEAEPALRDKPRNLIQALIAARGRGESGITDEEVSGNVLTMLLAGEDTTANTLAWLIWLLSRNPEALRSARDEVDRLLPPGGLIESIEQLAALDQVEACAHEAMRLKPVAPINILEAGEDVVVAGVLVPKGAFVVCVMRAASLEEANFSAPGAFDPARWRSSEDGSVKALAAAKRVAMPFGAGPRICPGRYLALAEIKIAMAMLLANFDIEEVCGPGGAEPAERLTLTMGPVGLQMRLRRRVR